MFVKLKTPLMMDDLKLGWVCSALQRRGGTVIATHSKQVVSKRRKTTKTLCSKWTTGKLNRLPNYALHSRHKNQPSKLTTHLNKHQTDGNNQLQTLPCKVVSGQYTTCTLSNLNNRESERSRGSAHSGLFS